MQNIKTILYVVAFAGIIFLLLIQNLMIKKYDRENKRLSLEVISLSAERNNYKSQLTTAQEVINSQNQRIKDYTLDAEQLKIKANAEITEIKNKYSQVKTRVIYEQVKDQSCESQLASIVQAQEAFYGQTH